MTEKNATHPQLHRYLTLLGEDQTQRILDLFGRIERGKYDKSELHSFRLANLAHPLHLRAIRADMQSFVNTFIDPYLENKPYLHDTEYVVDAGGNIGYTALLFANWWPKATVVSIEADGENCEMIRKNAAPYNNIRLVHGGLWNRDADLCIEAGQEDGFVVREVAAGEKVRGENLTRGWSLRHLLESNAMPRIDFLKMNIEGSEKEIFGAGTQEWLPRTRAMLIELHDGKNPGCSRTVFGVTNQHDFAVAETAPYGVLFVREKIYFEWYRKWYRENIYEPNINKERFPDLYLDR